jgi:glycosyltransferase involved in cell wall biosynthesis
MTALHTYTSYGRSAGSARVRVFDWLDRLEVPAVTHSYLDGATNSGRSLLKSPRRLLAAEAELRRRPPRDARVLVSRQASSLSRGGVERRLLSGERVGIYDFDDALHLDRRGPFPKAAIWRAAVGAADVVIAGNATLAEAASRINPRVTVIPSCVDPADYSRKTSFDIGETPRAIWIGSPATERYLRDIESALLYAHERTGMRLTVVSAGDAELGPLDAIVDRVAWSPQTFGAVLADADLGLMPTPDSAWSRGKCGYKLLQYGAAGLPMMGDPVGVNAEILRRGDGIAPESADDWADALTGFFSESATRRAERGAAGHRTVRDHYSFSAWESVWRQAVTGS